MSKYLTVLKNWWAASSVCCAEPNRKLIKN